MTVSATDVEATLRYIVPGFVALKVFYVLGLKTRRTDLEWTLWSLLAAALIDAAVGVLNPPDSNRRLLIAFVAAVAAGVILSIAWRQVAKRWPVRRMEASRRAWDAILPVPHWVQVWTKNDNLILGYSRVVAASVETDKLDLYIAEPMWVDAKSGDRKAMPGVAGVLISEAEIRMIQVMEDGGPDQE